MTFIKTFNNKTANEASLQLTAAAVLIWCLARSIRLSFPLDIEYFCSYLNKKNTVSSQVPKSRNSELLHLQRWQATVAVPECFDVFIHEVVCTTDARCSVYDFKWGLLNWRKLTKRGIIQHNPCDRSHHTATHPLCLLPHLFFLSSRERQNVKKVHKQSGQTQTSGSESEGEST